MRQRWRRLRKRKKDTWPNCAEGCGDQGARQKKKCAEVLQGLWPPGRGARRIETTQWMWRFSREGGREKEACKNCAEGCGGQGARTNRNLLKLRKQHILFFGLPRRHKRRIICSIFLVATFLFFRAPGRHNLLRNSRFGYGLLFSCSAERGMGNLGRIVCVLDRVSLKPLRNVYTCFPPPAAQFQHMGFSRL